MDIKYILKSMFNKEQHTNTGGNNAILASSNCFIGNGNTVAFAGNPINQQQLTTLIHQFRNKLTVVENQLSPIELKLIRELLTKIESSPEQAKHEVSGFSFVSDILEPLGHIATIWQAIWELLK